jgi:ATP-dependent protease HslVU (ClpYQ) ATPase subunit
VKTVRCFFIGAARFNSKPTDLIPELRTFPSGKTENLTKEPLFRSLQFGEPLIKQHKMLLATEGIKVTFTDDAEGLPPWRT